MAERIVLTAPVVTTRTLDGYTLAELNLRRWPSPLIVVRVMGPNGEMQSITYDGTTATTLMTALNKANLSTRSLTARVFDRLVADYPQLFTGTVDATPD